MRDNSEYPASYPDPTASREVKESQEYGLQYAGAIWADYTRDSTFYDAQRDQYKENRRYAEGLESIQKYKNRLDFDEDSSYVNLDFSPINKIATIVDNIVGKLMNQTFKVQCNPIDPESMTKYDDYRKKLYANMFLSKYNDEAIEATGIPLVQKGDFVPESGDDIEMHLQLNYKMDASMAMESAIRFVEKNNEFEETRKKLLRDLVVIKKAAVYRYYDENHNIRHEYVDPVDLITPYSKYDDFRSMNYVAVKKSYQLWEIALKNPHFSDKDLWIIAKTQAGANKNPDWNYGDTYEDYYSSNNGTRPFTNFNIIVLEYYFISQNSEKRIKKKKSKGGYIFESKPSDYSIAVLPSAINVIRNGKDWQVKGEKLSVSRKDYKTKEEAAQHFAAILEVKSKPQI